MEHIENRNSKYHKLIYYWLICGMVMLFFQVMIGGITRLTESGLSITRWEVISGTLPPMNEADWEIAFELYKETPQYKEVNEGITMSDFKFIYFWEYIHRLWARIMGFVFIIPFFFFLFKGWIDKWLLRRLLVLIFLAGCAASFGWIMVASGLVERPWVNAYKLSVHLLLAFIVIAHLWWTVLSIRLSSAFDGIQRYINLNSTKTLLYFFSAILIIQIFLGGMMSGMKIAVLYPTWPYMNNSYVPSVITEISQWNVHNFLNYDSNEFFPAMVHFLHRNTAYIVFIIGIYLAYQLIKFRDYFTDNKEINGKLRKGGLLLATTLILQMVFGITTLIKSIGKVPVALGVIHQSMALIVLIITLYIIFVTFRLSRINLKGQDS